ncbi:MAG: hypothetical protein ABR548_03600 [Actinomycetota bacterium]|nr:hypothetical protein [Actinomycetota bacterium]
MKRTAALCVAVFTLASLLGMGVAKAAPAYVFRVGAAVEDITPDAMPCADYPGPCFPDNKGVWLGGYGLGAAHRQSNGVVDHRISARAMVIANHAGNTLAFAMNETQGMFAAYQQGPYGLDDARRQINLATGIPMNHIVLGSDHSHASVDTTFVWGGVPDNYLKFIHDQIIKSVVAAYHNQVPATISVGSFDDPGYDGDQLGIPGAPDQDYVDKTIRVLQAKRMSAHGKPAGNAVVTFIEAPFHPTSYGSSHSSSGTSSIDSDWPGRVADWAASNFGGIGVGWEGDIGRQGSDGGEGRIEAAALSAMGTTMTPITDGTIDGRVQLMTEEITNPVYIWFLNGARLAAPVLCAGGADVNQPYGTPPAIQGGGLSLCSPTPRANTLPYGAVATSGLWATTFRIGDVLFSGGPGEVYPNLAETVRQTIPGARHFYLGLAQDQVGYIIGPATQWPAVVAVRDAEGNDNGLFNGGPTIGDHLVCEHIIAAAAMGFTAVNVPSYCAVVTASDPVSSALADQYGLS